MITDEAVAAHGLPGSPVSLPAWQALSDHNKKTGHVHLRDLDFR